MAGKKHGSRFGRISDGPRPEAPARAMGPAMAGNGAVEPYTVREPDPIERIQVKIHIPPPVHPVREAYLLPEDMPTVKPRPPARPAGGMAAPMYDLPPNPKAAFGAQKPDLSLIPPVADLHMAMAFEDGQKYGPFNWRTRAVEARTYVAACKRHLDAWLDGEEYTSTVDPETGETIIVAHNLGHSMACLAILLDAQEQGNLIDNRPPAGKSSQVQERLKQQKIDNARKKAK